MTLVAVAASDTTTTTGTGAVTLSGTAAVLTINGIPATTFATAFTYGGTIAYPISNVGYQISDGTNTETGQGTLTSATNLTRDLILASSNGGRHVNFIAGTKTVNSVTTAFNSSAPTWTSVMPGTLPENDIQSGTFTGLMNAGATAGVPITIRYKVSGAGNVTWSVPAVTATSTTSATVTITGIPAFLSPQSVAVCIGVVTNGTGVLTVGAYSIAAAATVQGTGTATLTQGAVLAAFTSATAVNGTAACEITYNTF
jgi:hypothetical protein